MSHGAPINADDFEEDDGFDAEAEAALDEEYGQGPPPPKKPKNAAPAPTRPPLPAPAPMAPRLDQDVSASEEDEVPPALPPCACRCCVSRHTARGCAPAPAFLFFLLRPSPVPSPLASVPCSAPAAPARRACSGARHRPVARRPGRGPVAGTQDGHVPQVRAGRALGARLYECAGER